MVKEENTRVMVTLTPSTKKMLDDVSREFGLNYSACMNMMIGLFHKDYCSRKEK